MKSNLPYYTIVFFLFNILTVYNSKAQTFVSTTPENKNVILENFSGGINNVYAPDGDLIAQTLVNNNPGDIFIITIHEGFYATPQGPGTDFNTSFGSAIAGQTNLVGYPAGTVNRHEFTGLQQNGTGTAMSRGNWSSALTQLLPQSSPVNIGIQASADMATNTLVVDIEVYYTGTQTVTSNMLNIAIVQNGILGPQNGGASYNPTAIDPATGLYTHNHMLRHMLTGQWGEIISTLTPGTLYSNQFTWVMPADIAGVTLDPTNIAVVAFVSEGNQEIISGTEVNPSLVFPNAYDAYLASAAANNNICSDTAKGIEVVIKNYGNLPLTTLDIIYDINGGTPITFPWVGNLTPGQAATVTLSNISYIASASNTVNISVANPNGNTDQNTTNDNVSTSFINQSMQGQVTTGIISGLATIDITTDGYPTQSTWEIIDDNGTVIASGSATTPNAPQAQATATLVNGACYAFNMYDSYGDGLSNPANGSYEVKDAAGTSIASGGGNFGFLAEHYFATNLGVSWDCNIVNGCIDPGTGNGTYASLSACQTSCIGSTGCTPDPQYVLPGMYPDSATGLADGYVGQSYNEVLTNITPLDTTTVISGLNIPLTIQTMELTSMSGLPPSFSYACDPPTCIFPGGSSGCINIYSPSPTSSEIGLHQLFMNTTTTVDAGLLGIQTQNDIIDYYYININGSISSWDCVNIVNGKVP